MTWRWLGHVTLTLTNWQNDWQHDFDNVTLSEFTMTFTDLTMTLTTWLWETWLWQNDVDSITEYWLGNDLILTWQTGWIWVSCHWLWLDRQGDWLYNDFYSMTLLAWLWQTWQWQNDFDSKTLTWQWQCDWQHDWLAMTLTDNNMTVTTWL